MRRENIKLTLVAIASVSTVGLFAYLALNQPDRLPSSPEPPPKAVEPAVELRHELPETPQPPPQIMAGAAPRSQPQVPEQAEAPNRAVDTDEALESSPNPTERPAVKERPDFTPRLKRKPIRPESEPRAAAPEKRLPPARAIKSRASFGTLPNKKGGPHEEMDLESSPPDPVSDFIGVF